MEPSSDPNAAFGEGSQRPDPSRAVASSDRAQPLSPVCSRCGVLVCMRDATCTCLGTSGTDGVNYATARLKGATARVVLTGVYGVRRGGVGGDAGAERLQGRDFHGLEPLRPGRDFHGLEPLRT
eukprot:2020123-Rhodomonas_salina.1